MNLADIIDPKYGLQQDEWSSLGLRFGKEDQLEVIGWSGFNENSKKVKAYIAFCKVCADDPELFGEGFFKTWKSTLKGGWISCGCGINTRWTEDQYIVRCKRKAEELGYEFLGWAEPFHGKRTKTKMLCLDHGEWETGVIYTLTNMGQGCMLCKYDVVSKSRTKPDEVMIESFLASGQFPEGTRFWRSERINSQGYTNNWYVYCPECQFTGEGASQNLHKGSRPCNCTGMRQEECYVNWIIDENNRAVALKFGIANVSTRRISKQNSLSIYEVRNHSIYKFPDKTSCLAAERECKQTLECGVLTKEVMPDGYTETTDVLNLVRIKQIYLKHGGMLIEKLTEPKVIPIISEFLM